MLERILDHRERQQIRKARQRKQAMRYGAIFFAIALVVLAAGAVLEAASPAEETKAATPVAEVSSANQQDLQEIDEFVDIMTKPIDELTSEEIDLMGEKAEDPCYAQNAEVEQGLMAEEIAACKGLK